MSRKKTIEEFIEQSKEIHGDKYDYSLSEYVNTATKVKLICPEHGVFEVRPNDHLSKKVGCNKCNNGGISKKKNAKDKILGRFIEKHGDKYDYSQVDYLGSDIKVRIVCPHHGVFEQTPRHHYNGRGCPSCVGLKPYTTESFIDKAKEIHGDKYDYSDVVYKNSHTKVKIICPEHGVFEVRPNDHLSKKVGCNECTKLDVNYVLKIMGETHDNRYQYVVESYKNTNSKMKIICPEHGEFKQKVRHHINGNGCPICNLSKGEVLVKKYLEENDIDYVREKNI